MSAELVAACAALGVSLDDVIASAIKPDEVVVVMRDGRKLRTPVSVVSVQLPVTSDQTPAAIEPETPIGSVTENVDHPVDRPIAETISTSGGFPIEKTAKPRGKRG